MEDLLRGIIADQAIEIKQLKNEIKSKSDSENLWWRQYRKAEEELAALRREIAAKAEVTE